MAKPDGGPAFPCIVPVEHSDVQGKDYPDFTETGMKLRDYFAAAALTGMLSESGAGVSEEFARDAYDYADAMMRERAK